MMPLSFTCSDKHFNNRDNTPVAIRKSSLLTLKNITVIRVTQDGAENINTFQKEGLLKR